MPTVQETWRQAPVATLPELVDRGPLLVGAPHPDDETIGAGALIASACRSGVDVYVDIFTDGSASHPGSVTHPPHVLAELRRTEAVNACRVLGVSEQNIYFGPTHDGQLHPDAKGVERLCKRIEETKAAAVLTTWIDDPHCDHKAAFWLAVRAAQASPRPPKVLAYPVWAWRTQMRPNPLQAAAYRFSTREYMSTKLAALAMHRSQQGYEIYDSAVGACLTRKELAKIALMDETFIDLNLLLC